MLRLISTKSGCGRFTIYILQKEIPATKILMVSISKPSIAIFFSAKNCTFYRLKVQKIALFSICKHIPKNEVEL